MPTPSVIVVGGGVGGLSAALDLASRGIAVTVLERASAPGGKMREVIVAGKPIDAGPTVFTMRWVFDQLFADAGLSFDDHVGLQPTEVLARHAWTDGSRLDLFADVERSADAVGDFAGAAEAKRFRGFISHAQSVYQTLETSFIRAADPSPLSLTKANGLFGLGRLIKMRPFDLMWDALGDHFQDPRLRQLYGRYATYCGSSPFLAPATLMLVAAVEQQGVWLVDGGMHRIAQALADAAIALGVTIRYGTDVDEVATSAGKATGVTLATGEHLEADAVIANADAAAIGRGVLGTDAARAVPAVTRNVRSLSAMTTCMVANVSGFPLQRHTVFFSNDYPAEFDAIFTGGDVPGEPTVYVCAQDRNDDGVAPEGAERLFCLVNAPALGGEKNFDTAEINRCHDRMTALLSRCGLTLTAEAQTVTTPTDFEMLFPGTGGALYGQATHGWRASFQRPRARTALPGLYLAGGSTHPGPGVPMAALSGRMAADALLSDWASTDRSRRAATRGGTRTR